MDPLETTKNARRITPASVSHHGKNNSKNLLNLRIGECNSPAARVAAVETDVATFLVREGGGTTVRALAHCGGSAT